MTRALCRRGGEPVAEPVSDGSEQPSERVSEQPPAADQPEPDCVAQDVPSDVPVDVPPAPAVPLHVAGPGDRAAELIAAGHGRRTLSRELGISEYEARKLLERAEAAS